MSRKLFEYFFDPEELEPFYSELTGAQPLQKRGVTQTKKAASSPARSEQRPTSSKDDTRVVAETDRSTDEPATVAIDADTTAESTQPEPPTGQESAVSDSESIAATSAETSPVPKRSVSTTTAAPDDTQPNAVRTRVRNMLSVHALGQYLFCRRSAILAAERGDERDIDEPLPRLTFLPNFELERIEESLSLKLKQAVLAAVLIVALTASMIVSSRDQTWERFYLAAGMLFLALLWIVDLLTAIVQLAVRRHAAMHAEAREPEASFPGTQPVNWWSMLNAGFEPITYQRPFQHPELPLEGCPWRVLHKDSLRIPVIRTGGDRLGNGKGQLFPKHELRLVAYALLLEADGHHTVPYGLVFPVDSPRGIAFSITENHRKQAVQLLVDFERQLNDSQQRNVQPSLPENRNRCANCDYGKPVVTSVREINTVRKAGEQVVVLQSRSDQIFRCDCGDRFGSAPPHRDSVRRGLRAILE